MLSAGPVGIAQPKIGLKNRQNRIKHGQAGATIFRTRRLKAFGKNLIDQRIQNDAWRVFKRGYHAVKLCFVSNKRIDMLDG